MTSLGAAAPGDNSAGHLLGRKEPVKTVGLGRACHAGGEQEKGGLDVGFIRRHCHGSRLSRSPPARRCQPGGLPGGLPGGCGPVVVVGLVHGRSHALGDRGVCGPQARGGSPFALPGAKGAQEHAGRLGHALPLPRLRRDLREPLLRRPHVRARAALHPHAGSQVRARRQLLRRNPSHRPQPGRVLERAGLAPDRQRQQRVASLPQPHRPAQPAPHQLGGVLPAH